jgi:penicillin-binding protein 1C
MGSFLKNRGGAASIFRANIRPFLLITALAATSVAALLLLAQTLPTFDSIKKAYRVSDRTILDRNGLVLDEIRVDKKGRRLDWVGLDQVSPTFIEVLLKAEDARFFSHPGVDPVAMVSSSIGTLAGAHLRGASTITMQVVGFIDTKAKRHRSFREKVSQILKALALERKWTKKQILEAYLNQVYFRGELQGLAAASHGLLDKAPIALTLPDSAVLASLIRAPNAQVDRIKQRACWLIESVNNEKSCADLEQSYWTSLEQGYQIRSQLKLAPHVSRFLVAQKEFAKSARIQSTLDRGLQDFATRTLQKHVLQLRSQNLNDGGVIVIENKTGNVLAYVGNIGKLSTAPHVDAIRAARQAGSTLKPFLYAKAIEKKILTAATLLRDEPLGITVSSGVYRPNNFDKGFRQIASVRSALGSSLNIPAVEALEMLSVDAMVDLMTDIGFTGLQRADYYGPSLALGSADVKLVELTNAYRALANGGVWSPLKYFDGQIIAAPKRVLSKEAAYVVGDILSDRESRAETFGLESVLSTSFWTAVKTGTSKDMRDNWCVGYSDRYTVGVWAGNFNGEPMWNVSGVQGAAPVWVEVMAHLHHNEPSVAPAMPDGVIRKMVTFPYNGQTQNEVFIKGTEPATSIVASEKDVQTQIVAPLDQTYIAMDPDIPLTRQKLFFQIAGPTSGIDLYLDGQLLGKASKFVPWQPQVGRHRLELRSNEHALDAISFEVRGRTQLKTAAKVSRHRLAR